MSAIKQHMTVHSERLQFTRDINRSILTDKSFHVIGRNLLGIPDQLIFRSSSATEKAVFL